MAFLLFWRFHVNSFFLYNCSLLGSLRNINFSTMLTNEDQHEGSDEEEGYDETQYGSQGNDLQD